MHIGVQSLSRPPFLSLCQSCCFSFPEHPQLSAPRASFCDSRYWKCRPLNLWAQLRCYLPSVPPESLPPRIANGSQHLSSVLTNLSVKLCRNWTVNTMGTSWQGRRALLLPVCVFTHPPTAANMECSQHSPWPQPWLGAWASGVEAGLQLISHKGEAFVTWCTQLPLYLCTTCPGRMGWVRSTGQENTMWWAQPYRGLSHFIILSLKCRHCRTMNFRAFHR